MTQRLAACSIKAHAVFIRPFIFPITRSKYWQGNVLNNRCYLALFDNCAKFVLILLPKLTQNTSKDWTRDVFTTQTQYDCYFRGINDLLLLMLIHFDSIQKSSLHTVHSGVGTRGPREHVLPLPTFFPATAGVPSFL